MTDVLASGKHLLNLINEVLDLAKVESGNMELQFEPAFLQDVFESVQHTMRALATKKVHRPAGRKRRESGGSSPWTARESSRCF